MSDRSPAGWYADPDHRQMQRYWDGGEWTEQWRPAPPPPPYGEGRSEAPSPLDRLTTVLGTWVLPALVLAVLVSVGIWYSTR